MADAKADGTDDQKSPGWFVWFSPPGPELLDQLRTIPGKDDPESGLSVSDMAQCFDADAFTIRRAITAAARAKRLALVEARNKISGEAGLIVAVTAPGGHVDGSPLVPAAELAVMTESKTIRWETQYHFDRFAWLVLRDELTIVTHAPFAGTRLGATAFAVEARRAGDSWDLGYLARLLMYWSEAEQWTVPAGCESV
jgi:hypothetical protein